MLRGWAVANGVTKGSNQTLLGAAFDAENASKVESAIVLKERLDECKVETTISALRARPSKRPVLMSEIVSQPWCTSWASTSGGSSDRRLKLRQRP